MEFKWQLINIANSLCLCWNKEMSELSRLHNDANAISLPARFITTKEAFLTVENFLNTSFEGGRHIKRIKNRCIKTYL